jgi:hypothetical protein
MGGKSMQKAIERLNTMNPEIIIKYEGDIFTVARATVTIGNTIFWSEGIARRAYVDEPNINRAHEIAAGRALKALAKKVICRRPVHHQFMG